MVFEGKTSQRIGKRTSTKKRGRGRGDIRVGCNIFPTFPPYFFRILFFFWRSLVRTYRW